MTGLKGKVALVTGGSRGIGAAIVKRLSEEGADVALTYSASRTQADKIVSDVNAQGGRAIAIHADSAEFQEVRNSVDQTVARFGGIDILVNNAAKLHLATIDKYSLEDFEAMMAVNIRAVFVATQEALKHMKRGGRVINIGSITSDFVPIPGASVYAMTKGAITSLTRGLARDLGPLGITVNNVQPGRVDTDLNPADGPLSSKFLEALAVQRFGAADEVAGLPSDRSETMRLASWRLGFYCRAQMRNCLMIGKRHCLCQ
jgi:3-oxoacyl-[acyl-carrier protein] reductase